MLVILCDFSPPPRSHSLPPPLVLPSSFPRTPLRPSLPPSIGSIYHEALSVSYSLRIEMDYHALDTHAFAEVDYGAFDYLVNLPYLDGHNDDYVPGPAGMEISDVSMESLTDVETSPVGTEIEIRHEPKTSFLDLPEDLQIRILQFAGLLRPKLIEVTFEHVRFQRGMVSYLPYSPFREAKGSRTTFIHGRSRPRCDFTLPVHLFLASQAIREQTGRLFFSHNQFSLFLHNMVDYNLFHSSFEWGFEHMKSLYVDLGPRDTRCLRIGRGIHKTVMRMWSSFCKVVGERMPNLQDFSMKCRVKDLEVATKLIGAMDPFPPLIHCAINFGPQPDNDIQPVIKRGVWRLTNNLGDRPPFPFLCLPKEVQYLILEQLLLMKNDPHIHYSDANDTTGIVVLAPSRRDRSSSFMVTCCGTCSPMFAMCFCHARQAAFSTTCTCFSTPLPYFLVSRGFYEDARRVFFSKNSFAFMDDEPLAMMRTLHYIPNASFAHMTRLIFKFPASHYYRSQYRNNHDLVSWSILRRFIREHFDLSRLSIVIIDKGPKHIAPFRPQWMRSLLKEFSDLKGVRDFRVYLNNDRGFEKEAERAVMGRRSSRSRPKLPFVSARVNSSEHSN